MYNPLDKKPQGEKKGLGTETAINERQTELEQTKKLIKEKKKNELVQIENFPTGSHKSIKILLDPN